MVDALRYQASVNLSDENNSHTLLVLLTGSDKKVLEVGPATGYMTSVLAERGCSVTCIEIDPEAAALAEEHCARMIVGNVEELDFDALFPEERFDVVIYGDVLEHLLDPAAVLRKTAGVLAPGGYVVASVPNVAHASIRLALLTGEFKYTDAGLLDRTHLRFFTESTLRELFEAAGYSIKEWRRTTAPPFGTEQGLAASDFPPYVPDLIKGDPNAETYQFVIRAEPITTPVNGNRVPATPDDTRATGGAALPALWELQERLSGYEERIAYLEADLDMSRDEVRGLERELAGAYTQINLLNQNLLAITGSIGYRLLERVRKVIRFFLPPGSPQRVPFALARRASRYRRRHGWRALIKRAAKFWEWPKLFTDRTGARMLHLTLNEQYQVWLQRHAVTPARAREMRKALTQLTYQPLISIIVPVYNPQPAWLRDAINSVLGQVYENWELCLADDGSTRPGVKETLSEYAAKDPRIKVTLRNANGGISAASNSALELATGEFIGLLDHDDELTPDALFEIVRLLNERPDLDYIYTDEDKKDPDGRRIDPFFKPDWSPDLLLSANYVTHFSVYRTSIVRELGGFRIGLEGSQDYDLVLRVTERTDRIAHIPKQLYSWRMVPGSAASSPDAKNFAYAAAKKAINEHFQRIGIEAAAEDGPRKGYYRVRYAIKDQPRVAIVIPTRDKADKLRRCIDSIRRKSTYPNYEIIIINNQSEEPQTLEYFKRVKARIIDYPYEFNYSEQVNLGVREAGCEYVILLNNDTEVITPDWIEAMLEHAQRPEVGAVGVRLFFPDGRVQHEGVFVGCAGGLAGHLDHRGYFALGECIRNCTAVTAACVMVKASLYEEVGGFDPELRVAYNDIDFCLKLREKGYQVIYTPFAQLYHEEGGTRGHSHPVGNEDLFRSRWGSYRDPYYNENFNLDYPFTLKL